jgi:hypothetical protein
MQRESSAGLAFLPCLSVLSLHSEGHTFRSVDYSCECSMNLPYPAPGRHKSRYGTGYVFAVFDKPNNLIVEFTGTTFCQSERA